MLQAFPKLLPPYANTVAYRPPKLTTENEGYGYLDVRKLQTYTPSTKTPQNATLTIPPGHLLPSAEKATRRTWASGRSCINEARVPAA
jgi:hypothetical protein